MASAALTFQDALPKTLEKAATTALGILAVVQESIDTEFNALLGLLTERLKPVMDQLIGSMADGVVKRIHDTIAVELSAEKWSEMLDATQEPTVKQFHSNYKAWRKLGGALQDAIKHSEAYSSIANKTLPHEQDAVKDVINDYTKHHQNVLDFMAEISTVQALCRPLQPGENRAVIAKRVSVGLTRDPLNQMFIPQPLRDALQAAENGHWTAPTRDADSE